MGCFVMRQLIEDIIGPLSLPVYRVYEEDEQQQSAKRDLYIYILSPKFPPSTSNEFRYYSLVVIIIV